MKFKQFLAESKTGQDLIDEFIDWLRSIARNKSYVDMVANEISIETVDGRKMIDMNDASLAIEELDIDHFPVPIGSCRVAYVQKNKLTSLKNAPRSIHGVINCSQNFLTSFDGGPESVGGLISFNNPLTSLHGMPSSVYDSVTISGHMNAFTTLEGFSNYVGGDISIECNGLMSLVGLPKVIHGDLFVAGNFADLEGIGEVEKRLHISSPRLTSLHNVHKQIGSVTNIVFDDRYEAPRYCLGLLLVKNLQRISLEWNHAKEFASILSILNKYLPNTRGMAAVNECQDELIEADLEDFAEL